ncbi:MAG TPA: hypothetical protein DIT97_16340, partial [Gimesia maris]|nr:hypothetical protein [Gimesia maris]
MAIRAICLQAMQASVLVYDDSINGSKQKRIKDKVHNKNRYTQLKSLYAGEFGVAEPLSNEHPICKILKHPNPTQSGA